MASFPYSTMDPPEVDAVNTYLRIDDMGSYVLDHADLENDELLPVTDTWGNRHGLGSHINGKTENIAPSQ